MKLGIVSDSHDHLDHLDRAVDLLLDRGIQAWIHLGDYVAPFTAAALNKLPKSRHLIFGNNDGEVKGLLSAFSGEIVHGPVPVDIDGRKFLLMHEPYALDAAIASNLYDAVLYGHTHQVDVRKMGGTLVLNPGACGGWMASAPTVAILDTGTLRCEILTVFGDPVEFQVGN